MKLLYFLALAVLCGCNSNDKATITDTDTTIASEPSDTTKVDNDWDEPDTVAQNNEPVNTPENPPTKKVYENQRFKDVTVEKVGENKFRIKGKGQIFEAAFSWVIEDGHKELKQGHEMTDAGAPAWGNFDFTVEAKKERPNSTLHIILYEASAKDGSRQHQLPIPLI